MVIVLAAAGARVGARNRGNSVADSDRGDGRQANSEEASVRYKVMETRIVEELRAITGNPRLEARDVMEWNASRSAVRLSIRPDEVMIECPKAGVWAAVTKRAAEVCSRCGCTQDRACAGGCYWIETRDGKACSACFHGTPDMFAGGLLDLVDGAR